MFLIVLPDLAVDDPLLDRIRRQEPEAVLAVYEAYFAPLYQYARLRVGDSGLAQDVVSEVFVRLIEVMGTWSAPREHLRGWLFRVARNEIYRMYGKNRPLAELEEWMPATTESDPAVQLGDLMELDRARHALRMLNPEHQEVLILRFGQQLSLRETADIMGKSVSAIKSLQFRAIDTLRSILVQERSK